MMGSFAVGFGFQLRAMSKEPDTYQSLLAVPLVTIVLAAIVLNADRPDLVGHTVVAPTLITLWNTTLTWSGEIISEDRENGRFESLVATPASMPSLVFGRLCASTVLSLAAFVLAVLVVGLFFEQWVGIHHPLHFGMTLFCVALATAATGTALSAVFVAAPGARIVQNSLGYPLFLLGGVMVPVAFYPAPLEILGRFVFLSWGADLMRDSLSAPGVENFLPRLFLVLLLGACSYAVGRLFITRFLRTAREQGTLSHS